MFQLFLRARFYNLLRSRPDGKTKVFKARSGVRDSATDGARANSVYRAIETALKEAEGEKAGLVSRIDEALMMASVSVGNDTDEYLTRETAVTNRLNFLDSEIANGQARLEKLSEQITHFKFLKTALLTRFSNLDPTPKK